MNPSLLIDVERERAAEYAAFDLYGISRKFRPAEKILCAKIL